MASGEKHRERELAFQILYGLSFAPAKDAGELGRAFQLSPHNPRPDSEPSGYAWELINGVRAHEQELDAAVATFSHNWRPERIGRIEMLLLRLALYEMFHTHTPAKVVITESRELADQFGIDQAKSFITGILDAAARTCPRAGKPNQKNRPGDL